LSLSIVARYAKRSGEKEERGFEIYNKPLFLFCLLVQNLYLCGPPYREAKVLPTLIGKWKYCLKRFNKGPGWSGTPQGCN
jgi:hypothetical protein